MTDKYAQLRAALDAGPTPGPWNVIPYQNGTLRVGHGPNCTVADIYWPAAGDAHANASLIAESRNALPVLLAEHDGLLAQRHTDSKMLREYAKQRDDLRKERDALREVLQESDNQLREVLASITDERVHFDGDEFHACLAANRAALAQEQGGSDDSQD